LCGIASYVGEGGMVVSHSCESLKHALATMLGDPTLRERHQRGCEAMARSLSWVVPIAENEQLYERCLSEMNAN
jgi:hypothetical protein